MYIKATTIDHKHTASVSHVAAELGILIRQGKSEILHALQESSKKFIMRSAYRKKDGSRNESLVFFVVHHELRVHAATSILLIC